jgi:mannose-6-phosphate isomerase-like protein (cupin superfamily)
LRLWRQFLEASLRLRVDDMDDARDRELRYYPRDRLCLEADVAGAKQWAVALSRTMLTYFEVEPHCRFETHSHESEQITLVLDGSLYFEQGDRVIAVKAGEVIAVPSGVPHAVFTKQVGVKAVDAWSPVMAQYRRA